MIAFRDCMQEVAFSFTNLVDKRVIHIASARLVAACNAHFLDRLGNIAVTQEGYEHLIRHGGLEPHRLNRIHGDIREPICYIDIDSAMKDGTRARCQQLVDGNHRYVRAWEQGQRTLRGWIVPEPVWRQFEIGEFPEDVAHLFADGDTIQEYNRTGFSGIA